MKLSRHLFGLVLGISAFLLLGSRPLSAQSSVLEANRNLSSTGTPASPPATRQSEKLAVNAVATIALGTEAMVTAYCRGQSFDRVGLRHDQTVDISVQYSTASAGQAITVEALDGGEIIAAAKNLIVAADGLIRFKFRAGHQPGVYQIALRNVTQELALQFWVLDEEHPRNNPPVVNR